MFMMRPKTTVAMWDAHHARQWYCRMSGPVCMLGEVG